MLYSNGVRQVAWSPDAPCQGNRERNSMLVSTILGILLIMGITNAPPPTPHRDASDTYHGVKVIDPYRWLKDGHAADVHRWSDAQNAYARAYLDKLPDAPALRTRVSEIMLAKTY